MPEKINLHTHTYRCLHAVGDVPDYCREAVKNGMTVLGFSDHVPFPDARHSWNGTRMPYEDLPAYRADVEAAKAQFPSLTILAGLELEYEPEFMTEPYAALKERLRLDYCIGGVHFVYLDDTKQPVWLHREMPLRELKAYVDANVRFMESGLIAYLAHPDISLVGTDEWKGDVEAAFRDIVRASIDLDIPLELNANGLRKGPAAHYPWLPFWQIAGEMGAECVAGSDAHKPDLVWDRVPELLEIADQCGLKVVNDKVVQKIFSAGKK